MSEITRILSAIEKGDPAGSEQLLPLVYDELRRLAAQKMAQESPEHTLQATALVHEAYLRLVTPASGDASGGVNPQWNSRGHFFAAAAEAMRRILVEQARRKRRTKHGGALNRVDLDEAVSLAEPVEDLLALDEALIRLGSVDPTAAKLVTLRYYAGMTMAEAAVVLAISLRSAERNWTYAKTWLHRELTNSEASLGPSVPN